MKYNLFNALCYDFCQILVDERPSLRGNWIVAQILKYCFKDWVEWCTERTMRDVDQQAEALKEAWQNQEVQKVVEDFQQRFPDAKVTLHDPLTGAVRIEHPPDGSKAQELLEGAMEIKSPWSLPRE